MSTIFGKIARGEATCKKVHENDEFLAFYDISPQARVHILIIPKKEFKDFNEVSPEVMAAMSTFIKEVAKIAGVDKTGYRLITNTGKDSGQEVPHLHFHLLGGETLGPILSDRND